MPAHLRQSRISNPLNTGHGKILILSSACDSSVSYHGWTPYCTSKAALTRFIACLAHEESLLSVQGVYPKLTRTKMPEDVIAGKFQGIMADHEIERFRVWDEMGDSMVEPPEWCGAAVARLALGLVEGGRSGETLSYDVHVPRVVTGTWVGFQAPRSFSWSSVLSTFVASSFVSSGMSFFRLPVSSFQSNPS